MHKQFGLLLLALCALTGCRTNPACERQIGLMRSELIALEDKYYILEGKYRDAVGQSGATGDLCDPLSLPTVGSGQVAPSAAPMTPPSPNNSDIRIQLDPNDSSQLNTVPTAPASVAAAIPANSVTGDVQFIPPRHLLANSIESPAPSPEQTEANVNFSEISPAEQFEGARAYEASPAAAEMRLADPSQLSAHDQGMDFIVRIPQDQYSEDGMLTVSVLDAHESHKNQRVGWWRFLGNELGEPRSSADGTSLEFPLSLTWNLNRPIRDDLMLFIRWEDPNSGPVEYSLPIQISRGAEPDVAERLSDANPAPDDWQPDR